MAPPPISGPWGFTPGPHFRKLDPPFAMPRADSEALAGEAGGIPGGNLPARRSIARLNH